MTSGASVELGLIDMLQAAADDVHETARFYRDVLGATVQMESGEWSQVRLGGVDIGFHAKPATIERWTPVFRVGDIAAVRHAVEQAGAPVLRDYHDIPGGVVLIFADPAGNPVQVVQHGVTEAELNAR